MKLKILTICLITLVCYLLFDKYWPINTEDSSYSLLKNDIQDAGLECDHVVSISILDSHHIDSSKEDYIISETSVTCNDSFRLNQFLSGFRTYTVSRHIGGIGTKITIDERLKL